MLLLADTKLSAFSGCDRNEQSRVVHGRVVQPHRTFSDLALRFAVGADETQRSASRSEPNAF